MFHGFQHLVHKVFFVPKSYPKVLILGQFHTSVSQTVKSDDVASMWTMTGATCQKNIKIILKNIYLKKKKNWSRLQEEEGKKKKKNPIPSPPRP